jgi:hypothetical protein
VTDVKKLIDIYAFLLFKAEYWTRACESLNREDEFHWMGYDLAAWRNDITARINQISVNAKRTELQALEKRLDALITVEQRRELELAEISKLV